jgi:hypothetical protein
LAAEACVWKAALAKGKKIATYYRPGENHPAQGGVLGNSNDLNLQGTPTQQFPFANEIN